MTTTNNSATHNGAGEAPAAATWGLLAAFIVHDLEELATMADWSSKRVEQLRKSNPWVPENVLSLIEFDQRRVNIAIGIMTILFSGAAADGARTGGRSPFYQAMLAGFGIHSVTHLAQTAIQRGYTPGAVTAPLVVAPFSAWAWRELRRRGVLQDTSASETLATAALTPLVLLGVHTAAYGLTRLRLPSGADRPGARRARFLTRPLDLLAVV